MSTEPPEVSPEQVRNNLQRVREQIVISAQKAHRNASDITLVAVTKYTTLDAIRTLLAAGVKDLGENRVQVAQPKILALKEELKVQGARLRMIGHLQTNKAGQALQLFDALDAVDSIRLLDALAKEAKKQGRTAIPRLAEVNVSGEAQKHGLKTEELEAFLTHAATLPELDIQGLMTMAPYSEGLEIERVSLAVFSGLRSIFEQANAKSWYPKALKELSMGMTNDFTFAIAEGATMLRIGSALFA